LAHLDAEGHMEPPGSRKGLQQRCRMSTNATPVVKATKPSRQKAPSAAPLLAAVPLSTAAPTTADHVHHVNPVAVDAAATVAVDAVEAVVRAFGDPAFSSLFAGFR